MKRINISLMISLGILLPIILFISCGTEINKPAKEYQTRKMWPTYVEEVAKTNPPSLSEVPTEQPVNDTTDEINPSPASPSNSVANTNPTAMANMPTSLPTSVPHYCDPTRYPPNIVQNINSCQPFLNGAPAGPIMPDVFPPDIYPGIEYGPGLIGDIGYGRYRRHHDDDDDNHHNNDDDNNNNNDDDNNDDDDNNNGNKLTNRFGHHHHSFKKNLQKGNNKKLHLDSDKRFESNNDKKTRFNWKQMRSKR